MNEGCWRKGKYSRRLVRAAPYEPDASVARVINIDDLPIEWVHDNADVTADTASTTATAAATADATATADASAHATIDTANATNATTDATAKATADDTAATAASSDASAAEAATSSTSARYMYTQEEKIAILANSFSEEDIISALRLKISQTG